MTKGLVIAGALLGALAQPAYADGNCHTYAMAAIHQYVEASHIPGCFKAALNRRWAPDYNAHRSWCDSVGPAVAHGEYLARRDAIARCRQEAGAY